VRAIDNEEYGTFPSHTVHGRLDHSFARGANDTGHYIGQSRKARLDHNTAVGNVSGFELENSVNVRADHNVARRNTAGILSFALPNLDLKKNSANTIIDNKVRGNNRRNTCEEREDIVCAVPPGTGILILAADANLVSGNQVTGNKTGGILVFNYCNAIQITTGEACPSLDIDPDPDHNRIKGNAVTGNGTNPDPSVPAALAADLIWDGTGDGNCWSENTANTTFPAQLPACPG
jgi:parallel beta-helix repeat protein